MKKAYANTRHGQVHLRQLPALGPEPAAGNPLVCLHPTPYSGLFYETIAPYLAQGRSVIAPDYPGYGASDVVKAEPSITQFAEAMVDALQALGAAPGYDLLGFHTGCLVAVEIAHLVPNLIEKLVLVDVPYFEPVKRSQMLAMTAPPPVISTKLSSVESAWQRNIASRWGVVGLNRSMALLAEELRTGTEVNRGFQAAFSYPCEERFASVSKSTLVIATQSSLLQPSRETSKMIRGCALQEAPEVHPPAMETGAPKIAELALNFLKA